MTTDRPPAVPPAGPRDPKAEKADGHLRPLERLVRRMIAQGMTPTEVAWRIRRSPRSVTQILELASRPDRASTPAPPSRGLRPLERRILAWRDRGATHAEIAARFRRSPDFVRRVEELARARLNDGAMPPLS